MSVAPINVEFDDDTMWVELSDGRMLGVPLAWFPRLFDATPEQRERAELSRVGLHWEDLDEDISVEGLLARSLRSSPRKRGPSTWT
jgi:hypothetical protein